MILITVSVLAGCSSGSGGSKSADSSTSSTSSAQPAVTDNQCPYVLDESRADFYPIQPSFSAGYIAAGQKLN